MVIKKSLIPGLIIALIVIIGGIIYFNYDTNRMDRILKQLNTKYPAFTISQYLEGEITDIDHGNAEIFRNNPHHAYVTFNDTLRKRINASYELNNNLSLDEVLSIGSYFIKEAESDKFFIYKIHSEDTTKYNFRLEDDLGYPLKKANRK